MRKIVLLLILGLLSGLISFFTIDSSSTSSSFLSSIAIYSPGLIFGVFSSLYFIKISNLQSIILYILFSILGYIGAFYTALFFSLLITNPCFDNCVGHLSASYNPWSFIVIMLFAGAGGSLVLSCGFHLFIKRLSLTTYFLLVILGSVISLIYTIPWPFTQLLNGNIDFLILFIFWQTCMLEALGFAETYDIKLFKQ